MRPVAIIGFIVCLFTSATAMAQQFHPSDSWAKVRVGGNVCFTDHEHYGMSPLWVSKKGAKAAAIRAWIDSTIGEYGNTWGSYRRAAGKRMSCRKRGPRWFCETSARPCKRRGARN